jgi:hypothetical protein
MFTYGRGFCKGNLDLTLRVLRFATVLGISTGLGEVAVGRLQQWVLVSMAELASQRTIPAVIAVRFYGSLGTILISVRIALGGWLGGFWHCRCPF